MEMEIWKYKPITFDLAKVNVPKPSISKPKQSHPQNNMDFGGNSIFCHQQQRNMI